MARFYKVIDKQTFLAEVADLMDNDHKSFPYDLPQKIKDDLSKVNFDWENYTGFNETSGYGLYPVGHRELVKDFHVFFINAGGDWEYPICFILYWNNGLRAYIPKEGNVWNKKQKCAYGSEDNLFENLEDEDDFYDPDKLDAMFDEQKMIKEILNHITKK